MNSKMQEIVDQANDAIGKLPPSQSDARDALRLVMRAIVLLSQGQQQVMRDLENVNAFRTDIPIG